MNESLGLGTYSCKKRPHTLSLHLSVLSLNSVHSLGNSRDETSTSMSVFELLATKKHNELQQLLQRQPQLANDTGAGGQTPLHLAAELQQPDDIAALLHAKADLLAEDGMMRTPLLLADKDRFCACYVALGEEEAAER